VPRKELGIGIILAHADFRFPRCRETCDRCSHLAPARWRGSPNVRINEPARTRVRGVGQRIDRLALPDGSVVQPFSLEGRVVEQIAASIALCNDGGPPPISYRWAVICRDQALVSVGGEG
jgi:hypothetical protein